MNVADTNAHTLVSNSKTNPLKRLFAPKKPFPTYRYSRPFLRPALVPNGETIGPKQGAKPWHLTQETPLLNNFH
jgi:hypothetical protein